LAIAAVVPIAMAVTNGAHVVCDSATEQFNSGAFISAVATPPDGEIGPKVCVTFPEWYPWDEYRTVEVSIGHGLYDRRSRLVIEAETPVLAEGRQRWWVGGVPDRALTSVRSARYRPRESSEFESTPGVTLPEVESWIDHLRFHIELSNTRDGVLYAADLGGDVRSGFAAVLARMRMALLPTVALLATYVAVVFLWRRAGPPPEMPPEAQSHFERPLDLGPTDQRRI
jgi:hypothetical protein